MTAATQRSRFAEREDPSPSFHGDAALHPCYPDKYALGAWIDSILRETDLSPVEATVLSLDGPTKAPAVRHQDHAGYVRFRPADGEPFYGYWQPTINHPAPLLVHLPGYSADFSRHPDLVAQGFNVLHVNPLGYATPDGADTTKLGPGGTWPVLRDTLLSGGRRGYCHWLRDCARALAWARKQPEVTAGRFSFFGTSQGGAGAILMGSMFAQEGCRCVAADEPFLTNFPLAFQLHQGYAYGLAQEALAAAPDPHGAWHGLGLIDTLSHAHRLTVPVLLTAGASDTVCPAPTISSLFDALPGTRTMAVLQGVGHRYTSEFVPLASAWFRMYA